MQIEIDETLCGKVQALTTIRLKAADYAYFVDFLAEVGLATVNEALRRYPSLTFGDLVMIRYRINHH